MFKKGNQFYLEVQILDEDNNLLEIDGVKKVQFNIKMKDIIIFFL